MQTDGTHRIIRRVELEKEMFLSVGSRRMASKPRIRSLDGSLQQLLHAIYLRVSLLAASGRKVLDEEELQGKPWRSLFAARGRAAAYAICLYCYLDDRR